MEALGVTVRHFLAILLMFYCDIGRNTAEGYCSTRVLSIPNGSYYLRSGNSLVRYECDAGFQMYGSEQLVCFGSKWSSDPPMCIANTCKAIVPTTALIVTEEFNGAVLKFSCDAMHKLNGSDKLICDGKDWSHRQPTCDAWTPPLACDFESADICGWSNHESGEQEWRRNSGSTPTTRTGPSYDHTFGRSGNGHYMYFETSSPTRTNHKALLMSPLYTAVYSAPSTCVRFYYHIHGENDIGELEVYVKPKSADISTLSPLFHVDAALGDQWVEYTNKIPVQTEAFQIVFVATRGTGYRSDFAVDDVSLFNCTDAMHPMTTEVIETTPKTTVRPTTTTKRPTTHPSTTTTASRPTTTTRRTTTMTTEKTTMAPSTTERVRITTPGQTSSTFTTDMTSNSAFVADRTTVNQNNSNFTHTEHIIVNPNLIGPPKKDTLKDRHGTSTTVYIIMAAGISLVVLASLVIAGFCYRRHQKKQGRTIDSLASTNPLYNVVNEDEGVQFSKQFYSD